MEAIKNEAPEQENNIQMAELLIVLAEVNTDTKETTFGAKTNDYILTEICKKEPENWEVIKKVTSEAFKYIEAKVKEEK